MSAQNMSYWQLQYQNTDINIGLEAFKTIW